jgi:hypothetical protein
MPTDDIKRLKLEIDHQEGSKLVFTLSVLKGAQIIRAERDVSLEKVKIKGKEWRDTLSRYEEEFWVNYNEGMKGLVEEARHKDIKEEDIREFILQKPEWKQIIDHASEILMKSVGQFIHSFSGDLLAEFLPEKKKNKKSDEFWHSFSSHVDRPILEAYQNDQENFWLSVPLLQIRIDRELLCLPWWLARTYDNNSLWCCRYALAVSPTLGSTEPPAIRLDKEIGVHLLSITRPTYDLEPWMPLSKELFEAAYPFIEDGKLSWRMLDGVLGDQLLGLDKESLFNQASNPVKKFYGVDKGQVRVALDTEGLTTAPNIILYQGHWFNYRFKQVAEEPPYIFLNNSNKVRYEKSDDKTASPISESNLPVPLLGLIPPPDSQNKILIMNACGSASSLDQAIYIQKYISLNSIFIGTNYPVLAGSAGPSSDALLRSILRNPFLAHALLEVNWLKGSLQIGSGDKDEMYKEIYKNAALCQFGDVTTSLVKGYDTASKDNRSRLLLKLTNRWKEGFAQLGLMDMEGMTFQIETIQDLSPAGDFVLADEGVQVALAPLVVAIDLCRQDPGTYVILGPAFSSRESVALISRKFRNWDEFHQELERRIKMNNKIVLGILTHRLTSTYMIQIMLMQVLEQKYGAEEKEKGYGNRYKAKETIRNHVELRLAHWGGQGDAEVLSHNDFLNDVDLSLSLNQTRDQLNGLGAILAEDIETRVVDLLPIPSDELPRGVFITRRKCLTSADERLSILEICRFFNSAIQQQEMSNQAEAAGRESPKDIPLRTYDRSNPKHLVAIQQFAQTDFFDGIGGFGWENFSHMPRVEVSSTELKVIVSNLGKLDDESLGILGVDKIKVAEGVSELLSRLTTKVETQNYWPLAGLDNFLNDELRRSKLADRVKGEIKKHFTQRLEDLQKEVIEVP